MSKNNILDTTGDNQEGMELWLCRDTPSEEESKWVVSGTREGAESALAMSSDDEVARIVETFEDNYEV